MYKNLLCLSLFVSLAQVGVIKPASYSLDLGTMLSSLFAGGVGTTLGTSALRSEVENKQVVAFVQQALADAGVVDADTIGVYYSSTYKYDYNPAPRSVILSESCYMLLCASFSTAVISEPNGQTRELSMNTIIGDKFFDEQRAAIQAIAPLISHLSMTHTVMAGIGSLIATEGMWHIVAPYIGAQNYMIGGPASYTHAFSSGRAFFRSIGLIASKAVCFGALLAGYERLHKWLATKQPKPCAS